MGCIKAGILTFHRAINYGAYLQACALCNRLNQEQDIDCEIIDFRMQKDADYYNSQQNCSTLKKILQPQNTKFLSNKQKAFERAVYDPIMRLSSESLVSDSQEEFIDFVKGKYDVIIAGSDEIWKIANIRGFPNPFWLKGDLGAIKVSYAASSRNKKSELTPDQIDYVREAWQDFKVISVRDRYTKELVDTVLGEEKSFISCDPSFLYDFQVPTKDVAEILAGKCKINKKKKNMLVMVTGRKLPLKLLSSFSKDFNLIRVNNYFSGMINVGDLSPLEWLQLVKNCDCVVTTYFHTTCFSLINNTPFVTFGSIRSSKIEGLFEGYSEEIQRHYILDTEKFLPSPNFKAEITKRLEKIADIDSYLQKQRAGFPDYLKLLKQNFM